MTRRWLIVVAVTLGLGALTPSTAAAESTVSFSVSPEPTVGQPVSITVSGTSSQAGELAVYMFEGSSPCPSVQQKEEVVLADIAAPAPVSAGGYSLTYSVTPESTGTYTLCGYLYDPLTGSIYATGTGSFNATVHSEAATVHSEASVISPTETTSGSSSKTVDNPGSATAPASTKPAPPPHLTTLTVRARDHRGSTAAKPGKTELLIKTTPYVQLQLVLKRHGHELTVPLSFGAKSSGKYVVHWSCSQPGGVYNFLVRATDSFGKSLTSHGKFHPVTAAQCSALKVADARRHQEEARKHEEEAAYRHREEAAGEREAQARERQEAAPVKEAEADQRALCESGLDGYGKRGYVHETRTGLESSGLRGAEEVETVCEVVGYHPEPRWYTLKGDHPITARYDGTEEPGP